MSQLDKEFIKKQKDILLKEKEKLEKQLKQLEKFPQYGDSADDNSEEVDMFVDQQGKEDKLLPYYQQVKLALKKIEKGTYGICENCGDKQLIDKKRLEAYPAATTCLKCDQSNSK